ncbi:hypothetical protein CLV78_107121 [Aliiruegeria haliotis]|uniref:Uncharacterized protein n=1 Tax=Aliiruegeria haliotis TaxID=1280846 RepID=A0A2T0RM35_9RHOB|nr:hypothetical protein CLV78_107121 [Aliiruegeria haliotis]
MDIIRSAVMPYPPPEFLGERVAISQRGFRFALDLRSCGGTIVLQAAVLDGLFLDLLSDPHDLSASSVVGMGGRQDTRTLMVSVVGVVLGECFGLPFLVAG